MPGSGRPDAGESVYSLARVLDVSVTMDPDDWSVLRAQRRNLFAILAGDCLARPFPHPYEWRRADVVIDGQSVPSVGVRKKGLFGSVTSDRPSLRIDTDRYVDSQRFRGLEHLTVNNQHQDPSRVVACLAYQCYSAAGLPAPRCNLAHVTVNGEDLGLYANVEPVKKGFLQRAFGTSAGALYEGTVSDFRDGWTQTFEPDNDAAVADSRGAIRAVVDVLADGRRAPDHLLEDLDAVIDLDQFFSFWAMEVLIGHIDGYPANANNFYVYTRASGTPGRGRLRFIPWGIDQAFAGARPFGDERPASVVAAAVLPAVLYAHPEGRRRYYQALRRHLNEVWDERRLVGQLDSLAGLARDHCPTDYRAPAIDAIRTWIQSRRRIIAGELADGPPTWGEALPTPPCLTAVGMLRARFSTTWGSLGVGDPSIHGQGEWFLELDGRVVDVTFCGCVAGSDPEGAVLVLCGQLANGAYLAACLRLAEAAVRSDTSWEIDWDHVTAWLVLSAVGGLAGGDLAGYLGAGGLTLGRATTEPGGVLEGQFSARVWVPGPI